jgi:hypothetical protein
MNLGISTRWCLYKEKDIMHFWHTNNFCESLSCVWSFFSSVNKIWSTVQGRILNCTNCRKHKHVPILGDARCHGQYGSRHVTHSKILKTQWGIFHITSPNNRCESNRANGKDRDKNSRWALHRKKRHMHRCCQNSMFDTDHQITTVCVFTEHSTVQWHTVPWLHTALIFCGTE